MPKLKPRTAPKSTTRLTQGGERAGAGPPTGNQNAKKAEKDKVQKKLVSARLPRPVYERLQAAAKANQVEVSTQVARDLSALYPDPPKMPQ